MEKEILTHDFQGWPVYKISLREILEKMATYTKEGDSTTEFLIPNDLLDKPVEIAHDDGMGYCGIMEYACEYDSDYNRIWVEMSDKDREELRKSQPIEYSTYIGVVWPEIQDFMEYDWYRKECFFDPMKNQWFIPKSAYYDPEHYKESN